jgi:hypothetical protein
MIEMAGLYAYIAIFIEYKVVNGTEVVAHVH